MLVDCLDCKERFRADKAPKQDVGQVVEFEFKKRPQSKKEKRTGVVDCLRLCVPNCGSPNLSAERQFSGMFRTNMGR